MAVTALPLTTKIAQGASKSAEVSLLVSKLGDNYEQRVPNGMNYKKDIWDITWENITNTEIATIEAAYTATRWGSDAFTWTPFNESTQKKFKCTSFSASYDSGSFGEVSMTLEQVFDI